MSDCPADDFVIVTDRLTMRPLKVVDADEMAGVLGDPSLHEFTGGTPATVEELRRRYARWTAGSESMDESWLNWVVSRKVDSVAVGTVQATVVGRDATRTAYIAWTIGRPWQRQGLAGEAATALVAWLRSRGIKTVVAHVHPDHEASARVAARAGLRRTDEMVDGEVVWRAE
ncbi:MAG TPA: GNAT family N-acetyltransferase [Ilumatobacteraceae bacterium]